jgi:hypothetical protein
MTGLLLLDSQRLVRDQKRYFISGIGYEAISLSA